jgi:hypothetical protein
LHSRIVDEIGDYLLRDIREKVNNDFVAEDKLTLSECMKEQYNGWALSRPSWPKNCGVCLQSQSGSFKKLIFGVAAPDPTEEEVSSDEGCEARPKLESLREKVVGGRKDAWWPWWQFTAIKDWSPEFAARVVIESSKGEVGQHPDIQEVARRIVQLAEAVEEALGER